MCDPLGTPSHYDPSMCQCFSRPCALGTETTLGLFLSSSGPGTKKVQNKLSLYMCCVNFSSPPRPYPADRGGHCHSQRHCDTCGPRVCTNPFLLDMNHIRGLHCVDHTEFCVFGLHGSDFRTVRSLTLTSFTFLFVAGARRPEK